MRVRPWHVLIVVALALAVAPFLRNVAGDAESPTTTTTHATLAAPSLPVSPAGKSPPDPEAEHQAALEHFLLVSAWLEATRPKPPAASADWDAIAQCETGGNWSMTGPRFSGGVGFANTTWNGYGGQEFAPLAGQATREEQIIVAERVHDEHGLSGWGCARYGR